MREALNRILSFLLRSRRETDLNEELEAHLAFATDEYIAQGLNPNEAKRMARLKLGSRIAAEEEHRESRSLPFLERLVQDMRFSARTLRREPAFALFAILIAGSGIAASVTVFSVLNTLLIRPLPFRAPDQLVWIANRSSSGDLSGATLQVKPFLAYRERNRSFSDVAAYFAFYGIGDTKLQSGGENERLNLLPVSQNFFSLLGIQPILGRYFSAEECKWNGPKAVLMSHGLWTRRFASDRKIVGRRIILDGAPTTVVGVLPLSFDFGAVFAPGVHMDLYQPFPLTPETDRWGNTISVIGRLKPGANIQAAQAEASVLSVQITREQPKSNGLTLTATSLKQHVSGTVRPALLVLGFAVAVVMIIVCANISNLLLARSLGRQKELAVRSALGAGRGRLIQQILTESLSLSFTGAILGVALALTATRGLSHLTGYHLPLLSEVRLDPAALLFSLALALFTGLIFGFIPALQVSQVTVNDALKAQSRGATDSRKHAWWRGSLVVAEIAFACVLIVIAGLLLRSFLRVLDVNLGFQPARAAAMRIDPGPQFSTPEQIVSFISEALRRVRDLPGVEAASITDALPLGRNRTWGAGAHGVVYKPDEYPDAFVHLVTEGYWKALGVELKAGRAFTQTDAKASRSVVVINESLAQRLWPGQSPLGRLIDSGPHRSPEVIGVVRDVRHIALEQSSGSELYFPLRQVLDTGELNLVVRSSLNTHDLGASIRTALRTLDPTMPRTELRPLQDIVDTSVSPRRFIVMLLTGFAAFAVGLASLGIYAVISYSVGQRKQEIGIRMALGASAERLRLGVLLQTFRLTVIGILIGSAASLALTQMLRGLLFNVSPGDPATFAVMLSVLLAVAAVAGYLPARRASRVNPATALRSD